MLNSHLDRLRRASARLDPFSVTGAIEQVLGNVVRARVPSARMGDLCLLRCPDDGWERPAEVIGLAGDQAILAPLGELAGISTRTEVIVTRDRHAIPVSPALLGAVVDGFGRPFGQHHAWDDPVMRYVDAPAPAPAERGLISHPLPVGIRAIDGLLTCAEGQRVGIFSAAGVGKTTLLSMIVNGNGADVCVIALIGERGREVGEFLAHELDAERRKKTVVVVATADRPAMERLKAGFVATAIAEYFRERGNKVLLLMDSVTRLARAQREIGLAAGEIPARRGFPPSMFTMLPKLFERAGTGIKGSITAFYTVLVEGDDMNEPVSDEVRSLLDGHIVLSRELSAENHYPAIDVLASLSRVMQRVISPEHRKLADKLRNLLASHKKIELLVRLGEYQKGNDPLSDEALQKIDAINAFLRQASGPPIPFREVLDQLRKCLS
ncbi:FliI/YscN family ATPase [Oxalobacteraceae bacterium CAVE-383]|nr:FliI/YscN family ATPase [Oxalobacteraceae bacterium CAVE-383]